MTVMLRTNVDLSFDFYICYHYFYSQIYFSILIKRFQSGKWIAFYSTTRSNHIILLVRVEKN